MPIDPEGLKALFTKIVTRLKDVEVELEACRSTLEIVNSVHPDLKIDKVLQDAMGNNLTRQKIYRYYDQRLANFVRSVDKAANADRIERLLRDDWTNPPGGRIH